MMPAYDKVYLDKARISLGRMLDFAVYDLKYDISVFFELFISTGTADIFGSGDFSVIAGMSGVELAYRVLESAEISHSRIKPEYAADRSKEYWTGWALAYYQWKMAFTFEEINKFAPINDIVNLYYPYHEMDIKQFCDKLDELYRSIHKETNLKFLRKNVGLSQRELAEMSGVPLRTIQQYEQRQKNINKANAECISLLANALNCEMKDLMEHVEL